MKTIVLFLGVLLPLAFPASVYASSAEDRRLNDLGERICGSYVRAGDKIAENVKLHIKNISGTMRKT